MLTIDEQFNMVIEKLNHIEKKLEDIETNQLSHMYPSVDWDDEDDY